MSNGLFFAFSNPTEGNEAAFNDWYNTVHIHEVCGMPGVVSGQRYTVEPLEGAPLPSQSYLAVYEISASPAEIMQNFVAGLGTGTLTVDPSLDLTSMQMSFWSPSGPLVSAAS